MGFQVVNQFSSPPVSDSRTEHATHSDPMPEVIPWEKIKDFFCQGNNEDALKCIKTICHPPVGTTREDVENWFEQLRTLAYSGCKEMIQSGRHGEDHFCILAPDSQEMVLSVRINDDCTTYTVECQGHTKTHNLPSSQALDSLTHNPREHLQYIIAFFTVEDTRKQNHRLSEMFAQAMTTALTRQQISGQLIPDTLTVEYLGHTITFTQPDETLDPPEPVRVSHDGETAVAEMESEVFRNISTALLLRHKGKLPLTADVLTSNRMNLKFADLHGANLYGASLQYADLHGADLHGANLNSASLHAADLPGANLNGASLNETNLNVANLHGADLTGANLHKTQLNDANLNTANLSGANLHETALNCANLSGANLSGVSLHRLLLVGANLSGAELSHINTPQEGTLCYYPNAWGTDKLDIYLNHINNIHSGSLLTMINSIDEKHTDVKLRMVRELIASLNSQRADLSSVALPLMNILLTPPYTNEPDIADWMVTVCGTCPGLHNELPSENIPAMFTRYGDMFAHLPELMRYVNGAFTQLIAHGMAENSPPEMKQKAAALYATFLAREDVQPYCGLPDFGDGDKKPDWSDPHATNFILLPVQPDSVSAMLLSQASLASMLNPDINTQWNNVSLYKGLENLSPAESPATDELFTSIFPLFSGFYHSVGQKEHFNQLLDTLNMDDEMRNLFVSAAGAQYSERKLVDDESREKLNRIFTPKLTYSVASGRYSLDNAHYDKLIDAFGLPQASDMDKARTLLCLAVLFTHSSSSALFGTEDESPEALRNYAYALMAKAHTLDKNLLDTPTLTDWTNRLLGLEGAYSCSAVLSSKMVKYIRTQFPKVLVGIMPPAWG